MAQISSKDRGALRAMLQTEMSSIQNHPLRGMFALMQTLLDDYEKLEKLARSQLRVTSSLAADMGRLSAELHGMAKSKGGNADIPLRDAQLRDAPLQ